MRRSVLGLRNGSEGAWACGLTAVGGAAEVRVMSIANSTAQLEGERGVETALVWWCGELLHVHLSTSRAHLSPTDAILSPACSPPLSFHNLAAGSARAIFGGRS